MCVGLRCQAFAFDPSLFSVFRDEGQAVGACTAHIDDILGCREPDVLTEMRSFLEQLFRGLKLQEEAFVHLGMELASGSTFFGLPGPRRSRQEITDTGHIAAIMGCATEAALPG